MGLAREIYRAQTPAMRLCRESFIDELLRDLTVYPYTQATGLLGAKIDGEQQAQGVTIPFAELLIGETALELGFSVLTVNLRDFRLIPASGSSSFSWGYRPLLAAPGSSRR
jgi:predicted nucleic acid-binding protein